MTETAHGELIFDEISKYFENNLNISENRQCFGKIWLEMMKFETKIT